MSGRNRSRLSTECGTLPAQAFNEIGNYRYDCYKKGVPVSAISVFGTDGYERVRSLTSVTTLGGDAAVALRPLAWYARKSIEYPYSLRGLLNAIRDFFPPQRYTPGDPAPFRR
jgi:hypothetical protein